MMRELRDVLSSDDPLELLTYVSFIVEVLESIDADELEAPAEMIEAAGTLPEDAPGLHLMCATLLSTKRRETKALLTVIAALCSDDVLRSRVRAGVKDWTAISLPTWLERLDAATVIDTGVVQEGSDGDALFVEISLPPDHRMTFVAYIDHALGTVVSGAAAQHGTLAEMMTLLRSSPSYDDRYPPQQEPMAAADVRARVAAALSRPPAVDYPYPNDNWPAFRPLVGWITRVLPPGGHDYDFPELTDEAIESLVREYLASSEAAAVSDVRPEALTALAAAIIRYTASHGHRDPLHVSETSAEILLMSMAGDGTAPQELRDDLRAVLSSYARYAHRERGIASDVTERVVEAIADWAPDLAAD